MSYDVDILRRYKSAHGFIAANAETLFNAGLFAAGIAYNNSRYQQNTNESDYKGLAVRRVAEYSFADIELRHGDRSLVFALGSLVSETENVIAPPPLISFKRSKNLTVTTIDQGGDDSEIVEFFSLKSYDITFKGVLVDMDEHQYPASKVKELTRFFEINDTIEIISPLFQDMGIDSIYFTDLSNFEPVEGFPDTVRFTIQAKSIKPEEITILNGV